MKTAKKKGELPSKASASKPSAGIRAVSQCNATALRKATRRISQLYDAVLAPCGLRSTQRSILVHIARAGKPSIGDLAADLVLDRSALTHNLKPLERDGLVRVVVDDADKRSRVVQLTRSGTSRLEQSNKLWRKAQETFENGYGARRSAELRRTLDLITAIPLPFADLDA